MLCHGRAAWGTEPPEQSCRSQLCVRRLEHRPRKEDVCGGHARISWELQPFVGEALPEILGGIWQPGSSSHWGYSQQQVGCLMIFVGF